ncbi:MULTISPECIES: SPW repeat domain-containing protein [Niastella]|uniref:SPW repeat protein n=1 Tax=Niastella soli TaxID=2821487 RepID=A0ABS3YUX0_9BACT|nr:SPW repeat protein [Niastella soli]MBO9201697.1 SPW repeat protein [Niastella soli]
MKPINTKVHGCLDYIMGVLLIAAPWIFDFTRNGAETWVPVILGITTILYSLLTNYELGVARMISMRSHLTLDMVGGIFLAVSPWLFGFVNHVWQPHLLLGILEIGVVLMTRGVPDERHAPVNRNIPHKTATGL